MLAYASRVVIVPGYGLAVAQAQHNVRELADLLEKRGVDVKYAIHPVAGRMPGHMNVLLAEANVPYPQLYDMEDINPEFPRTDVALVIGANDVTNPAAREDPESPLYGMPILNVDASANVVVLKRSMSPGFAGIDNDLFYRPNTAMLFGDAKASVERLVAAVKAAYDRDRLAAPRVALVARDRAERVDDALAEEAVWLPLVAQRASATGQGSGSAVWRRRSGNAVRIHPPAPPPALLAELADDERRRAAHLARPPGTCPQSSGSRRRRAPRTDRRGAWVPGTPRARVRGRGPRAECPAGSRRQAAVRSMFPRP